jgi:hypothetical protein
MANPSPLHVLLAGLVLLALYSVPLFSTVLPPLFDYPNHLARFAVLAAGGNQFYELRWAPLPNLAGDIIVPLLARAMPLALAGKLFLVMIFALILGGTAWLNRIVSGKWRFWPLLAAAFLYNLQLRWGFLNYLFGLGIALCGAALWLALEPARIWLRVGASAGVALLCYFSHISAFGVYALIVAGLEMQPGFAEWRGGRWRALRRRAEILVAQLAVPAVIAVAFWHPAGQSHIVYEGWSRKLEWLFGIFYNYDPLLDFGCFFLLLALLGTFAVFRRLNVAPRLVPAILLVLLAYLLLPTEMFGAWATDQRLPASRRRDGAAFPEPAHRGINGHSGRDRAVRASWRRRSRLAESRSDLPRRSRRSRHAAARRKARGRLSRERPRDRADPGSSCAHARGRAPQCLRADALHVSRAAADRLPAALRPSRRRGVSIHLVGRLYGRR